MKRLSPLLFLYVLFIGLTPQAQAQTATAYFHSTLFDEIFLNDEATSIPHMTDDGRAGTIIHTWRENGNAWGYHVYMVTATSDKTEAHISPISLVEIDGKDKLTASPHTGDDALSTAVFARGTKQGETTSHLYLITVRRPMLDSVPDPSPTTVRIYRLIHSSPKKAGHATLDRFVLQESINAGNSSNTQAVLKDIVGLTPYEDIFPYAYRLHHP
ncbi:MULTISPECIES: hypothetical protein [unclassified Saccharibacter]|uniref:hypothetical protein n=1 Tax=unclassified Saccharibacter TaxID=2648722 RepID=UPI00132B864A|nr:MULTISPECIES: hypothetical protein [unclassified Saccharibacter]MXV36501.1 hypothetical protein [Saccharibacter sp. EH611]MXV57663.1 hypothetical protein [Saccharibacter sp. EH70]MXV65030.1 hypothetical protein [Saccharibacter sp. EH60]